MHDNGSTGRKTNIVSSCQQRRRRHPPLHDEIGLKPLG
jgi:hypothetical protein